MDKLQMAHEWYLKQLEVHHASSVMGAWQYADAMQAEAEKRSRAEAEQKRKEIREMLKADNTFIEREGQHFDDVYCEVDWSQAPEESNGWAICKGFAVWFFEDCIMIAPSFGFTGTHIVERPHGF